MTPLLADSHCHLAHVSDDAAGVVAEALDAGVEVIVDIGMGTAESAAAARRAVDLAPSVYAAVGVHPNDLGDFELDPDATMSTLRELATQPRVVGVGETGLDFYRRHSSPSGQEEALRRHIRLAREVDRTLVVHCRDAHDRLLAVLDDHGPPERVVMHCFSGDVAFARACAERGFFCSFAGNITYKRSDDLRMAARTVPPELLLVETDAPYLAPEPHRGRGNRPSLLPNTAAALAQTRSMPVAALAELLRQNTTRAFGLA